MIMVTVNESRVHHYYPEYKNIQYARENLGLPNISQAANTEKVMLTVFLDEKGVPTTYHLPCSNKVQGLCYAELLPKLRKAVSRK